MWEVQHYTLADGWVNTWTDTATNLPIRYDSRKEAEEALNEHLEELHEAVLAGDMEAYSSSEFRVHEVPNG
jgi:hypothetical protein